MAKKAAVAKYVSVTLYRLSRSGLVVVYHNVFGVLTLVRTILHNWAIVIIIIIIK